VQKSDGTEKLRLSKDTEWKMSRDSSCGSWRSGADPDVPAIRDKCEGLYGLGGSPLRQELCAQFE
jgi:hypothetical protein